MLNRLRSWGGRAAAGRNWLRLVYLANVSTALLVILIYLFDFRLPSVAGIVLAGPAAIAAAYGALLLIWLLVDGLGWLDSAQVLQRLVPNPGLRWLDVGLAAFAAAVLLGAWYTGLANEPLWTVGGLALANGLLSLAQHRWEYAGETLAAGEALEAGRPEPAGEALQAGGPEPAAPPAGAGPEAAPGETAADETSAQAAEPAAAQEPGGA